MHGVKLVSDDVVYGDSSVILHIVHYCTSYTIRILAETVSCC